MDNDYIRDEGIKIFIKTACQTGKDIEGCYFASLFQHYVSWCAKQVLRFPLHQTVFSRELEAHGYRRIKTKRGMMFIPNIAPLQEKQRPSNPEKVQRDLHESALDAVRTEQELRQFLAQNSVILGFDRLRFNTAELLAKSRAYVESLEHLHCVESRAINLGVWG